MLIAHGPVRRRILALLMLGWCTALAARAQPGELPVATGGLPPGLQAEFESLTQTADGSAVFTGAVTLTWRDSRIQADRLTLRGRRHVEAEGNVLIVWGKSRIFGARMTYDLETEQGVIEDAMGQALDEYLFWAKEAQKIGAQKLRLVSATVTTCTQPVPYWSFSVSSATITLERYARMWNVRLRGGKAPVIYLPFLVWPVKEGRAAGLLMPELHSSQSRGSMWSQQLFIPLGRSADVTLEGRHYNEVGFGGGGQLRFIPNAKGRGELEAFFITDEVYARQRGGDGKRYRATYRQEQQFLNGFRMIADIDLVSDSDYLSDFQRDLNVAASPQTLARLEFSRNGPWASINVRELRREQLSSGLVQQTLPEIEWRGRNSKLGRSPFYLSFAASAASIRQRTDDVAGKPPFDPDYLRGDVAPEISVPLSPVPWLDVTPRLGYRLTHYTQRQALVGSDPVVEDRSLTRGLWAYGVELTGPKLYRIYEPPEGKEGSRYKHSIETRVAYGFAEAFDEADDVLLYDEVDRSPGAGTQMNYSLVQRLFARRPRSRPEPAPGAAERVQLPDGTTAETTGADSEPRDTASPGPDAPQGPGEPLEIASLEIRQERSFDDPISIISERVCEGGSRDAAICSSDGDCPGGSCSALPVRLNESRSSPIRLTGRYNPSRSTSLDIRSSYDVLWDSVRDVTLSGSLRHGLNRTRFSLVHANGLGSREDSTQLRLTTAQGFFGGKLNLRLDGSYNADPTDGTSHFPEQRWQLEYTTQCCTFFVERLTRDFGLSENRRELHFRVDLRGVGKILSSTF